MERDDGCADTSTRVRYKVRWVADAACLATGADLCSCPLDVSEGG